MHRLILDRLRTHEPRSGFVAAGRVLLALTEFSVLAATPDADLFVSVPDEPGGPVCTGLHAMSLWCFGSGQSALTFCRVLALVVLALVMSGYRPKWTCVPHWYVTFSFAAAVTVPNGGEHAAATVTLLLIPVCLGDDRVWQWRRPTTPVSPRWLGAAYAGHLALRVQVCLIYAQALWTKVVEVQWWRGTAVHYVFQDPYFGALQGLREAAEGSALRWSIGVATWGTLVLELAIAVSALLGRRWRVLAVLLGVLLHGGIAVLLGLPSFGLAMVGLLCVAVSGASAPAPNRVLTSALQKDTRKPSDARNTVLDEHP